MMGTDFAPVSFYTWEQKKRRAKESLSLSEEGQVTVSSLVAV